MGLFALTVLIKHRFALKFNVSGCYSGIGACRYEWQEKYNVIGKGRESSIVIASALFGTAWQAAWYWRMLFSLSLSVITFPLFGTTSIRR